MVLVHISSIFINFQTQKTAAKWTGCVWVAMNASLFWRLMLCFNDHLNTAHVCAWLVSISDDRMWWEIYHFRLTSDCLFSSLFRTSVVKISQIYTFVTIRDNFESSNYLLRCSVYFRSHLNQWSIWSEKTVYCSRWRFRIIWRYK